MLIGQQDPRYPDWIPYLNNSVPILAPNPDTIYYVSRIEGSGTYKISGNRGTVRLVDIQIARDLWGLADKPAQTFLNVDLDTQHINADGTFEIILSPARPAGYNGNWIKLDEQADHIFVRQVSYDWLREVDARLAIERLDVSGAMPRRTAAQVRGILSDSAHYVAALISFMQRPDTSKKAVNSLGTFSPAVSEGLNTRQVYMPGQFEIGQDEALILESDVPARCRYWGIQIADQWKNSIDYMHRQSSINGYSARIDSDGKIRVVFSPQDPGVPNWIDTSGYPAGSMLVRWYDCDSRPVPTLRKVHFDDVRKVLPPNTPLIDSNRRQELLRERSRGAQLRRRW